VQGSAGSFLKRTMVVLLLFWSGVWGMVERLLRAALPKGWESTRNHRCERS
jgi:hypothetical protein